MSKRLFVEQFRVGGDRNFGYLAADEVSKEAAIIDPSFSPQTILDCAKTKAFAIRYVFNTHNHIDHTNGNSVVESETGLKVLHYFSTDTVTGRKITDGAVLSLGEFTVTVLHTPGHTKDSICVHIGDALFTGDTLFVGKVGGTDFGKQAKDEYESLHGKLLILPDETRIFPGHDYGTAPESTMGNEKKTNPFLLQPDFKSFVELKKNWLEYKRIHGIA